MSNSSDGRGSPRNLGAVAEAQVPDDGDTSPLTSKPRQSLPPPQDAADLVGSVRRELLDRALVWNRPQLEQLLREYVEHYGCKSSGSREVPSFRDELAIRRFGVNRDLLFASALVR